MKRNFLKFCFVGLGSVALLSACVEADNLDSIEQLQDVTAKAKLDQAKATEAQNRQALADKVYTLQTNVATLKGDILALEASENQIEFLSADYELQVAQQESELAGLQPLVAVLAQVKASVNYQAGIDSVAALLKVTAANYEKNNLAYEKALGLSNSAYELYSNALSAYNKANAALSGYGSLEDLKLDVDAVEAKISAQEDVVAQWKVTVATTLQTKTEASTNLDAKYVDMVKKQAIVDNAKLLYNDATDAQKLALSNAVTAYNAAEGEYTTANNNYNIAASKLLSAENSLKNLKESLVELNQLVIDGANLPSLKADKEVKYAEYLELDAQVGRILAARNAADNIATAQADLIKSLQDENSIIDQDIYDLNSSINDLEASIQANNDKIAQLAGGFNTNTSKLVAEWIAAANAKIAAYEAIIASYKI